MSTCLLALLILGLAESPEAPDEPEREYVLEPAAATEVRALLGLAEGPLEGVRLDVKVAGSVIRIKGQRGAGAEIETALGLTLVHPDDAPDGAVVVGGVALLERPGPAPADLVASLIARMRAAEARRITVPWKVLDDPSEDDEREEAAAADAIHQALDVARWRHASGDPEGAREALGELPRRLPGGLGLEVAATWRRLGDQAQAKAVLDAQGRLAPAGELAARAILGEAIDLAAAKKLARSDVACGFAHVAGILADVGRLEEALPLAAHVREQAPRCPQAWESEIHRLLESGRHADAATRGDEALRLFEGEDGLAGLVASVYVAVKRYRDAAPILERLSRAHPEQEGVVRVLLSAILRDPAFRLETRERLEARHAEAPDDRLSQFLLGVIHHYDNHFERSNALLAPLEEAMGHQQRLHIYRSMNDFNLGRVEEAIARLDEAAKRDLPDPDVFYCRAEILRDSRRVEALADLRRYQADAWGAYLANPDKEVRVNGLVASLERCIRDRTRRCEGEWEHPRLRLREGAPAAADSPAVDETEERSAGPVAVALVIVISLVIGTLGLLLVRRRRPASRG